MSEGRANGTVHGSAVRLGGAGVLIRGPSGSGKSGLALALISDGAELVADDRVVLRRRGARLEARAPSAIAGLIEVRGQGIFRITAVSDASLDLIVDLCPPGDCPRLPEPKDRLVLLDGVQLSYLRLPVGSPDGAMRVRWALAHKVVATC